MSRKHRGDAVVCPCCGQTFAEFEFFRRPNRRCWNCMSLERQRMVVLWLEQNPDRLRHGASVLHIAPELALRDRFRRSAGLYVAGDLEQEFGPQRIDVTDLAEPEKSFDVVVCSHVLEHVPDDRRALQEIHRVLRPDGWALLNTPISGDTTDEDPSITDPAERLRRFKQEDHVRIYGWDYLDRIREAGFNDVTLWRPEAKADIERYRLAFDGKEPAPLIIAS